MSAEAILQQFLDELGDALLADDWQTYRPCAHLPCQIIGPDGNSVLATEAELREGFEKFRDTLRFYRVTDYVRLVETVEMPEADVIAGSYVSHLISTGHRLLQPFRSQITLRHIEGRWRGTSVTNGLSSSRWATMLIPSRDFGTKGPTQ